MNSRLIRFTLFTLLALAIVCAAAILCAYLAGCVYYLLHKTMPRHVSPDTWYRYWLAWSGDPVERRRLLAAALIGTGMVLIAPLWALMELGSVGSPLHGDARWANAMEIRKAGLL
ncbi:hypothetical protein [Duganella sp. HH105]|uniref:hypothetical protein n=1 Tax=Duganella sp. HH105 TaxID=1781067 RepID=UPI000877C822|nr:hypothetical protein [Duganella sp. HH105]OEZ54864.1 hypothetical protein DUGA6_56350 [Duganella sp. HH105]